MRTTHTLTDMLAITTPLPQGGEIVLRDRDAPVLGLRKGKIGYRTRYLSDEGYARLWRTLGAIGARWPAEVKILRLPIFTGARLSEISGLAWADLDGARLHLATAYSGPRIIWLNRQAHAILDAWRKTQRQKQNQSQSHNRRTTHASFR